MKKILSAILSALLLCSAAACSSGNNSSAENSKSPENSISSGDTVSSEAEESSDTPLTPDAFPAVDKSKLPSKIDLRNYNGKNYVTPVKNQKYGDCWTFALAAAAENSYLFSNELGVPAGEENNNVNFSEKYIAWYMYHGITKDDVIKGRVRASQVGEGFDISSLETNSSTIPYVLGSPFVQSANFYASGFGPVDESQTVNGEKPYTYDDSSSVKWQLPLNSEYRSVPAGAYLKSSYILPDIVKDDAQGKYQFNEDGLNAIKHELSQGHGVCIAISVSHSGLNTKNMAVYCAEDINPDHSVTVVGYDDDYPKENFTRISEEKEIENSTPPSNGALIIKNSWGASGEKDSGYFYLSYYDHTIQAPLSYSVYSKAQVGHDVQNIDQYDLMMTRWYGHTEYTSETKTANIFYAEENEFLFRIGYRTSQDKTEVKYEIYKNVNEDDPTSGTLLESGVDHQLYAGFHTVDLKGEYTLLEGQSYSIVLTMKRLTEDGGKEVYTEVFPYSTEFIEGVGVKGIINKGESFLFTDGKWNDLTSVRDSLIERACKNCSDEYSANKRLPELKLKDKDNFTVDNYSIKAITFPES